MNKYIAGSFLSFAIGVGAITQGLIEAVPKPLAKMANDMFSGASDKKPVEQPSAPDSRIASNHHGLKEYAPTQK